MVAVFILWEKQDYFLEMNYHYLWHGVGERTVLEKANPYSVNFIRNGGITYMLGSAAHLIS